VANVFAALSISQIEEELEDASSLLCLSFFIPATNFACIFPFLLLISACCYLLLPTK
jgi:hypothetical protein